MRFWRLLALLRIGDGTDSRYDRNNPLAGNEQTAHDPRDCEAGDVSQRCFWLRG